MDTHKSGEVGTLAGSIAAPDVTRLMTAKQDTLRAQKEEGAARRAYRAEFERQMFVPIRASIEQLAALGWGYRRNGQDKTRLLSEILSKYKGALRALQDSSFSFHTDGNSTFECSAVMDSKDYHHPHYLVGHITVGYGTGSSTVQPYFTVEAAVDAILEWFAKNGTPPAE
jgi:hypothetical protein